MKPAVCAALLALACQGGAARPAPPGAAHPTHPVVERAEPAPGAPESPFPTPDELRELARESVPEKLAEARFVDADEWTLAGPFPQRAGEEPIATPSPFEAILLEQGSRRAGLLVASESMRCAAREIGRFFLEREGPPSAVLQRFILGRCGATGTGAAIGWLPGGVPPERSEAEVAAAWGDGVRRMIAERLGSGPRAAGIWFGRRGEEGLVLFASAPRAAHLDPVSLVADEQGRVRIQGELLSPAEEVGAVVNRGRVGFQRCEPDPDTALPRFAFTCATDHADAAAWIGVGARRPARLLSDTVLMLLARPAGAEATRWRRLSYVASRTVADPDEARAGLIEALNQLRTREGLGPVALEERESETAGSLAPLYFGATLDLLPPTWGDLASLGLLAGWEVAGTIRDGDIAGGIVLGTRDLDRWFADAIEQPGARSVLFDPQITRVAVGPVVSTEHEYLGALVAGYALFGDEDAAQLRQAFYARLDRAFDSHKLAFPSRDRDAEAAAERHLARVAGGATTPDRVLAELLAELSTGRRGAARGWWLEGSSAGEVVLPDDLFSEPSERVAAAVGHYRPAGWPWGRAIVLLVTTHDAPLRSALAAPREDAAPR